MIGSIFLGSWRNSDSGLLNMSNLNYYLVTLFAEHNIRLNNDSAPLPVVYGDGVFPLLPIILPRYVSAGEHERRINTRLAAVRQSIEHKFALYRNVFALFQQPQRFKLLHNGQDCVKIIFNSFLLLNCYTCLNESGSSFCLRPPSLAEYLPLNEEIPPRPQVTDAELGDLYDYHRFWVM